VAGRFYFPSVPNLHYHFSMSIKPTDEHVHSEPLATTKKASPPWDAPAAPEVAAEFTRLGEQIQDLKNRTYAGMDPENQARMDSILTTYANVRERRGRTL
jgi:hypothetical protein